MQLSSDEIREAVKKHGSQRKAAAALGIAQSSVNNALNGRRDGVAKLAPQGLGKPGGRSLNEFRETHDKNFIVPKKIKAALAALGGGWEYEMAFAKMAGISLGDLSAYRSMFEEDHVVVIGGSKRAWAGTKLAAEKMRAMVL